MFRKTSAAAVISAMFVFSARIAAASCADPTPITTQAAYQSWIAWYHADPSAPADANGPRFRQLLSAADGDRYFLQGLDDASPQVRELSKRGLVQSPTDRSYTELMKRLSSLDAEVRRQSQEILAASAIHQTGNPEISAAQAANACGSDLCDAPARALPEAPHLGPSFNWAVPFGGLMRVALARGQLDGQQRSEWLERGLDPDILDLVIAIRDLEFRPGSAPDGARQDEVQRLKRLLAQTARRQASKNSGAKLLELLSQTTQSSPLDDVTVEQVKQALARHVGRPVARVDQDGRDPSSEPLWTWPTYRMRVELERQVNATPIAADQSSLRQALQVFKRGPAIPPCLPAADPFVGRPENDDAFNSNYDLPGITEQFGPGAFPAVCVNCPVGELHTLAPGVYKLLLTFESSPSAPFGFDAATLRPPTVGAIVFRVKAETREAIASHAPDDPSAEKSLNEPAAWQVLFVAISNLTLSRDDLCMPAPATFALRTKNNAQQPVVNFMISSAR